MLQIVDSSHWALVSKVGYTIQQPYYFEDASYNAPVKYWYPKGELQTIGIMTHPSTESVNVGWLRQGGSYNGQTAVDHLQVNGLVIPADMMEFQSVHPDVSIKQVNLERHAQTGWYCSFRTEYYPGYTVQIFCRSVQNYAGQPWKPYIGIIVFKYIKGKWGTFGFQGRPELLPPWASPSGDESTPDVIIHKDRLDRVNCRPKATFSAEHDSVAIVDISSIKSYVRSLASQLAATAADNGNVIRDKLMRECINDLPVSDETNNIANAIQIVNSLHSLAKLSWSSVLDNVRMFRKQGAAKKAADGWLAWRYSYNTTKSDIQSEIATAKKRVDLALSPGTKKAYATHNDSINVASTVVHRKMTVAGAVTAKSSFESLKGSLYAALDSVGVAPTWSRIWDLLPFSFIVDWAVPFSDFANARHLNKYCSIGGKGPEYDLPYDIRWVSHSRKASCRISDTTLGMRITGTMSYYNRVIYDTFVVDSANSWDGPSKTSAKTWLKRTIDSASLIIGMRR